MRDVFTVCDVTVARVDQADEKAELTVLFERAALLKSWQVPDLSVYEPVSIYWAVYLQDALVGGLQIAFDSPVGLPYEMVWPDYAQLKPVRSAEIVQLAVLAPEPDLSLMLRCCAEMRRYCNAYGITYLFTAINDRRLARYRHLGCPFEVLAPKRVHWGSPSNLVGVGIEEVLGVLDAIPTRYRDLVRQQLERSD